MPPANSLAPDATTAAPSPSPAPEINNDLTAVRNINMADGDSITLYSYSEFENETSIRLVVLHPGSFTDHITCDIISCDLNEAPDFEALSYTWANENGDKSLTKVVHCGRDMKSRILVTDNCKAALRRLRSQEECRVVWIDAICINQAQAQERGHQVSMMSHIYRTARRVMVYLGEGNSTTDKFVDVINGKPPQTQTSHANRTWLAASLFSRSWFERLWVLQEIILARKAVVVCGDRTTSWQQLSRFFVDTYQRNCHSALASGPRILFEYGLKGTVPVDALLDLFTAAQSRKVSEPLDRVYALLGIIDQDTHGAFRPDYTSTSKDTSYRLAVYFQNKFNVFFPPGLYDWCKDYDTNHWVLLPEATMYLIETPWSWLFDWSGRQSCNRPIYFDHDFSIVNAELRFRGREVLEGFFELPLMCLEDETEDRICEVRNGYFGATHACPPEEYGNTKQAIAVKVSETAGVLLHLQGIVGKENGEDVIKCIFLSRISNLRPCLNVHGKERTCSDCSFSGQWLSDLKSFVVC